MTRALELADIQGNIIKAYGRYGFPKGRNLVFAVNRGVAGRWFVNELRRIVTTSERWGRSPGGPNEPKLAKPQVAVNVAFTFRGLIELGLPTSTLAAFPPEFMDGMAARSYILGDDGPSAPSQWDPAWQAGSPRKQAHILVMLNAQMNPDGTPVPEMDAITDFIVGLTGRCEGGVELLTGHARNGDGRWQDMTALLQKNEQTGGYEPTAKEHFGYTDGIGDPVFEGQYLYSDLSEEVKGRGKLLPDQTWAPLATGEFLLGHPDESQEIPPAAEPSDLMRNGTFMTYRKLHENVALFHSYVQSQAERFVRTTGAPNAEAARQILMAKFVGRWQDGVPLMAAPTLDALNKYWAVWSHVASLDPSKLNKDQMEQYVAWQRTLIDFKYADDQDGTKCPFGSHLRRGNPRDMLDPELSSPDPSARNGSVLINRRRILRRGLPYGPDRLLQTGGQDSEQGIIFMAICANLQRQFEFVQQQWIQYGLDFNAGNDRCPLIGTRMTETLNKFVIASDPATGKPPFIAGGLPDFVETRGGDYFFIPSLTALRMIAMGIVDPT